MKFELVSPFLPAGDQPKAIEALSRNLELGLKSQTLLGVTGSGKTFTMANVIQYWNRPTLVISHNKTLAAQLYQEFKAFFPNNSVHYFVSYYDYYQPEAYIPQTDTYIEKDAKINDLIDSLRHAATASILSRPDTIVIASVSCIYGLGNPAEYERASIEIKVGEKRVRKEFVRQLISLQYKRNDIDPRRGEFRVRPDYIDIHSPSNEEIIRIEGEKGAISRITIRKPELESEAYEVKSFRIFPGKHFVPPQKKIHIALANIKQELKEQIAVFKKEGKLLEAQRIEQKTNYDIEMLLQMGYAPGIENYSRHLDFRNPGEPPFTLLDYFRFKYPEFLTIIDESHATIPQVRGMYAGDRSRKETLIQYGFRLPSALDNRPLQFPEFNERIGKTLYVSATPSEYELEKSRDACKKQGMQEEQKCPAIVEQIIRPTGLIDPVIEIRKTKNQISDVADEIRKRAGKKERSLVLALTKRLAEDISEYLRDAGLKTEYIHSDIKTLDRPEILKNLRLGNFDALVGINLLREGLDLPEVSFIAILDADKEGFLRNDTTLLQIIGRAARHINGTVVLYADGVTGSMKRAIDITNARRSLQDQYNKEHGIVPMQVVKDIRQSPLDEIENPEDGATRQWGEKKKELSEAEEESLIPAKNRKSLISGLTREMHKASKEMNFERAAKIRDRIEKMKKR